MVSGGDDEGICRVEVAEPMRTADRRRALDIILEFSIASNKKPVGKRMEVKDSTFYIMFLHDYRCLA